MLFFPWVNYLQWTFCYGPCYTCLEFVARGFKSNFSMDIVGVFAIFSACLDHPTTYSSTYRNKISETKIMADNYFRHWGYMIMHVKKGQNAEHFSWNVKKREATNHELWSICYIPALPPSSPPSSQCAVRCYIKRWWAEGGLPCCGSLRQTGAGDAQPSLDHRKTDRSVHLEEVQQYSTEMPYQVCLCAWERVKLFNILLFTGWSV